MVAEYQYFALSTNKIFKTVNLDNTILLDLDVDGKIVGIETVGKKFSLEIAVEILKSFVYPEVITLPTGKPIMFKV